MDPRSQAGYRLAIGVGSLIGFVTLLIICQWWISAPSTRIPAGFSALDPAKAKALAESIKSLGDESVDRSVRMFDATVGRVLLPVFTSLLGYLFGTREASQKVQQGADLPKL